MARDRPAPRGRQGAQHHLTTRLRPPRFSPLLAAHSETAEGSTTTSLLVANLVPGLVGGSLGGAALPAHVLPAKQAHALVPCIALNSGLPR